MQLDYFGITVISDSRLQDIPYSWTIAFLKNKGIVGGVTRRSLSLNTTDLESIRTYWEAKDPSMVDLLDRGSLSDVLSDNGRSPVDGTTRFGGWIYLHGYIVGSIEMLQTREFDKFSLCYRASSREKDEIKELFHQRFGLKFSESRDGRFSAVVRK